MPPTLPSVLGSAKYIASRAKLVRICPSGVETAARELMAAVLKSCNKDQEIQVGGEESGGREGGGEGGGVLVGGFGQPDALEPPGLMPEETLEWLFLVDMLNFCFWSDKNSPLFSLQYKGKQWTGYQSLCAGLAKAVERGTLIYRPSFYSDITLDVMRSVFTSSSSASLPLLEERVRILKEAGSVLEEQFHGSVSKLVLSANKSAQKLVQLLAENFGSFHDVSTYKGKSVTFLKRAQIFAADVWSRFGGKDYGEFTDIDSLTMFADYRVPQSLLYFGVLEYSSDLMDRLLLGNHLPVGSEEEAEIRGCSIWGVELIKQKLVEMLKEKGKISNSFSPSFNSILIDYYLWNYAKLHSKEMSPFPIHRTRTIFY